MNVRWDLQKSKRRINGNLMGQFVNRQVKMLGQSISFDNKTLKLKCTDGHVILVLMAPNVPTPLVSNDAYVEVDGIVESKNKLRGFTLTCFPLEMMKDFSPQIYNEMIGQMMINAEANTYFVTDPGEHFSSANGLIEKQFAADTMELDF